jgi:hypothetical protein
MQVQITFIKSGSSSQFGNFAPGDKLRCSKDHAQHFVVDAECAVYTEQQETPALQEIAEPTIDEPKKRGRKPKEQSTE